MRCCALLALTTPVAASTPAAMVLAADNYDPPAKMVVKAMDSLISNHVAWNDYKAWGKNMEPYWTPDFRYDTVEGFPLHGQYQGVHQWFNNEHTYYDRAFWPMVFSQMILIGTNDTASTTTYGRGLWLAPLGQADPAGFTGRPALVRICDFYKLVPDPTALLGHRISYNWMMIDMVELLRQAGQDVLPKPKLPEGWVQPPKSLDGVPAPISFLVDPKDTEENHVLVSQILRHELEDQAGPHPRWNPNMVWYGPTGIGVASSVTEYHQEYLKKLYSAFANVQLQIDVSPCEGKFCGVHGYIHADHVGEFLGEPASGKRISLRFGSHWHVYDGSIMEGYTMMDFPALFRQLGVNLFQRGLDSVTNQTEVEFVSFI